MKVKINPRQLFNQGLDLRQYLDIAFHETNIEGIYRKYDLKEDELISLIEKYLYLTLKQDELPDLIEVDYEGNKHYTEEEMNTLHSGWQKYAEAMARVEFLEGLVELNNATINKLLETNNQLLNNFLGVDEDAD